MSNYPFMESVIYSRLQQMNRLTSFKYRIFLACGVIFCINWFSLLCYRLLFPASQQSTNNHVRVEFWGLRLDDDIPRPQSFRSNILFLKIPQTGGRTIQNILFRFGVRHSLDVMLPEMTKVVSHDKLVDSENLSEHLIPVNGKFNIFACESRYHPNIKKVMPNDTIRITLLRDPVSYFESFYNFSNSDVDNSLLVESNTTFDQFLRSLTSENMNGTRSESRLLKGVNQMSQKLGLDRADNPKDVNNFIDYIDREFDFVMISEYYDECLILLADLMGWPLRYVSYLPPITESSASSKINLTPTDTSKLRKLNPADAQLYDYFVRKLGERARQYGTQRLLSGVRKLERLNDDLKRKCISKDVKDRLGMVVSYELRANAESECIYASKAELNFIDELREKQIRRFDEEKAIFNFIRNTGNRRL